MTVSPEALGLLRQLQHDRARGYKPRPPKSKARDELKRRGLIETAKPGGLSTFATPFWQPTVAGVALLAEAGQ